MGENKLRMTKYITLKHLNRIMQYLRKNFCAPLAKKLETPVKINGVEFDGTKDINIAAAFETDDAPTADSTKYVTSGAVYKAIHDAVASIEDGDKISY